MKLISHRGNLEWRNPELENSMSYIIHAIEEWFYVEIDLWWTHDWLWLWHDKWLERITIWDLMQYADKLYIHCKNINALQRFSEFSMFNYFVHDTDFCTLTSKWEKWAFPGNEIRNSIFVLPEWHEMNLELASWICSDYILQYKYLKK